MTDIMNRIQLLGEGGEIRIPISKDDASFIKQAFGPLVVAATVETGTATDPYGLVITDPAWSFKHPLWMLALGAVGGLLVGGVTGALIGRR